MPRWKNVRKKTCCRVPVHKASEITRKKKAIREQAPIERRPKPSTFRIKPNQDNPNRPTFCTQSILFNRYTTKRRKVRTSETRLSLSLVENTSPEESRWWNFRRQKSKKRRETKHSQWSYGASSLSGLHLWSNLLRAESSSFHCRAKTFS